MAESVVWNERKRRESTMMMWSCRNPHNCIRTLWQEHGDVAIAKGMAVHCPPLLLGYPLCWALQCVMLQNRLEHVLEHAPLPCAGWLHCECLLRSREPCAATWLRCLHLLCSGLFSMLCRACSAARWSGLVRLPLGHRAATAEYYSEYIQPTTAGQCRPAHCVGVTKNTTEIQRA